MLLMFSTVHTVGSCDLRCPNFQTSQSCSWSGCLLWWPIECSGSGRGDVYVLQVPEEMQSLLCSLGQGAGVGCPGEVFHDVNANGLVLHHSLYCWPIYALGRVTRAELGEVNILFIYFFCLSHRKAQGLSLSQGQSQELRSEHLGLLGYQAWQQRSLSNKENQKQHLMLVKGQDLWISFGKMQHLKLTRYGDRYRSINRNETELATLMLETFK